MPSAETNTYLSWTIPVTAILSATVAILGYKYAMMPRPPTEFTVPTVGTFFTDVLTFIPHILLLFGVLADMLTYRGVYSIASLVGLVSIPVNFGFSFIWSGLMEILANIIDIINYKPVSPLSSTSGPIVQLGGAVENYDGCNVQGFSALASPYAPQTLVVTASVFAYYIFDLIGNRGWTAASATIVMFAVLYAAETFVIGSCAGTVQDMPVALRSALALAEGLFVGGVSYAAVQAYFPERLPSTALPMTGAVSAASLKPGADGKRYDAAGNAYTVLPDGTAVPATQSAANDVVSMLSTGSAAQPASCSA